jgi:hypothetical protein
MLSTQNLGIKVTISLSGDCLGVCLATDLDALVEVNMFRNERIVKRKEIQSWDWMSWDLLRGRKRIGRRHLQSYFVAVDSEVRERP